MDRVRFGRALGVGAREAAKAVMKAADAAVAPNPEVTRKAGAAVAGKIERAKVTTAGVKRGGKKFGEAMWGPFAKASGVLWLEVTGVLFGLFAAVAGLWSWNQRADLMAGGLLMQREWGRLAMFALFLYLTVSSYVRAARRSRR